MNTSNSTRTSVAVDLSCRAGCSLVPSVAAAPHLVSRTCQPPQTLRSSGVAHRHPRGRGAGARRRAPQIPPGRPRRSWPRLPPRRRSPTAGRGRPRPGRPARRSRAGRRSPRRGHRRVRAARSCSIGAARSRPRPRRRRSCSPPRRAARARARARLTTRVLAGGPDLYLVGGGDPTLTDPATGHRIPAGSRPDRTRPQRCALAGRQRPRVAHVVGVGIGVRRAGPRARLVGVLPGGGRGGAGALARGGRGTLRAGPAADSARARRPGPRRGADLPRRARRRRGVRAGPAVVGHGARRCPAGRIA